MADWMRCSVRVSTEAVASSSTRMRGSAKMARAKDSSCFSPVDSRSPPLAYIAVQALLQLVHHFLGGDQPEGGLDLLLGGVRIAVEQIFPDGAGEQVGGLEHIADGAVEPQLGALPDVPPVNGHLAAGRFKKPADQVDQG